MRSVQKVSSHILWKIETFIEKDKRNIVHRTMTPQSPSKYAPWDLTQFSQLPSATLSCFPESHQQSEISSLSQVILVLGKARSHRVPNLGWRGNVSSGWFDVSPKSCAWDVMHKGACCRDEAANHQLPTAVVFSIIPVVSVGECSSLTQHLMQICCSARSVILNVMATQYTRSLNGIYCPTDWYSEVIIVYTWACQATLLGCQVAMTSCNWLSLY